MKETEAIEFWKNNEKPFGLCPEDMRKWAVAHEKDFEAYTGDGEWSSKYISKNSLPVGSCQAICWRLRQDYVQDLIEVNIVEKAERLILINPNYLIYTDAPSVKSINRVRVDFAGYKYSTGQITHFPCLTKNLQDEYAELIFPTHVIFKRK